MGITLCFFQNSKYFLKPVDKLPIRFQYPPIYTQTKFIISYQQNDMKINIKIQLIDFQYFIC